MPAARHTNSTDLRQGILWLRLKDAEKAGRYKKYVSQLPMERGPEAKDIRKLLVEGQSARFDGTLTVDHRYLLMPPIPIPLPFFIGTLRGDIAVGENLYFARFGISSGLHPIAPIELYQKVQTRHQ